MSGRKLWTLAEDKTLEENWGKYTIAEIEAKLPDRTWSAVRNRANALGLGKNKKHFKPLEFDADIAKSVENIAAEHSKDIDYICNRIHYLNRIGKL